MFEDDPQVPEHHAPLIRVWQGRAAVSRYLWSTPIDVTIEPAMNWQALEPQAVAAVLAPGGTLQPERTYHCPPSWQRRGGGPRRHERHDDRMARHCSAFLGEPARSTAADERFGPQCGLHRQPQPARTAQAPGGWRQSVRHEPCRFSRAHSDQRQSVVAAVLLQ